MQGRHLNPCSISPASTQLFLKEKGEPETPAGPSRKEALLPLPCQHFSRDENRALEEVRADSGPEGLPAPPPPNCAGGNTLQALCSPCLCFCQSFSKEASLLLPGLAIVSSPGQRETWGPLGEDRTHHLPGQRILYVGSSDPYTMSPFVWTWYGRKFRASPQTCTKARKWVFPSPLPRSQYWKGITF